MTIRDWPKDERPREKLLLRGPASLSDAELLAVFLRTGVRSKTAVDLARELLRHFGGLTPLLDVGRADLRGLRDFTGLRGVLVVNVAAVTHSCSDPMCNGPNEKLFERNTIAADQEAALRLKDGRERGHAALRLRRAPALDLDRR